MLNTSKLVAFVATTRPEQAKEFYHGKLGLEVISEDQFAVVFNANGTTLRVAIVRDLRPAPFTVLGWEVHDIEAGVKGLTAVGIGLEHYGLPGQDTAGIWRSPSGARVAWFKDPDGNLLSVSQL
jgi:catechol 2,3-dioxygenase-like lactoylglutathione lyase family enzyme